MLYDISSKHSVYLCDTDDLSHKSLEEYSLLLVGSTILGAIGFSLKEGNQKHE